jgi:ribosome recycling factor
MEELNEVYDYAKEHMEKSLEVLKKDFTTIRTGCVSTHIVDSIKVDYYGTPTPLNQVGSVIATDAQTITISPWEKNLLPQIEHAIQQANIGVNPNNDGETIKLFFPPMTVEQRQESAKQAKAMGEKAKIAIRNIRRDANDKVKKLAKEKVITEDEEKKGLDQVQKITDDYIKKVDELVKAKEAEVLKV